MILEERRGQFILLPRPIRQFDNDQADQAKKAIADYLVKRADLNVFASVSRQRGRLGKESEYPPQRYASDKDDEKKKEIRDGIFVQQGPAT